MDKHNISFFPSRWGGLIRREEEKRKFYLMRRGEGLILLIIRRARVVLFSKIKVDAGERKARKGGYIKRNDL